MKVDINKKKEILKEKMNREVDAYFKRFEQTAEANKLNINEIEQIMVDSKSIMNRLLNEAAGEIARELETSVTEKKNVRTADEK